MSRHGKIARLPRELREELNSRIDNGEPAVRLVDWLNSLPEAQKVLQAHFGGRPISEQNLSEWKCGGFCDWQARQDALAQARELASNAKELTEATDGRLTDHLATVLASRYAAALAGWNGEVTEEFRRNMDALRTVCQDIVELRRGDHSGARLNLERERMEREREKSEEEVFEVFRRWAGNAKVRDCLCQRWKSPEERERRLREIFGLDPETPDGADATPPTPDPDELERLRNEEKQHQMCKIFGIDPASAWKEQSAASDPETATIKPNQTKSN